MIHRLDDRLRALAEHGNSIRCWIRADGITLLEWGRSHKEVREQHGRTINVMGKLMTEKQLKISKDRPKCMWILRSGEAFLRGVKPTPYRRYA